MTAKAPTAYILASRRNGTLYVGVTAFLDCRLMQHHESSFSFSKRYRTTMLVYYEQHIDMISAITREKRIKW
jgi:putative endonuclease